MSSFPETKAEKLICQQENAFFLKYHQVENPKFSKMKTKHAKQYFFTANKFT